MGPAICVRRPGQVLGQDDAVLGRVLDRGDAGSFVQLRLDVVELADVVVGRAAGGDSTILDHGDPTGIDAGHRVDRHGHDLCEDVLQIADAASVNHVPSGSAQSMDQGIGLVGLHAAVPPSQRARGCSTQTCAGWQSRRRHALRSTPALTRRRTHMDNGYREAWPRPAPRW
jgi:hypothetical protein